MCDESFEAQENLDNHFKNEHSNKSQTGTICENQLDPNIEVDKHDKDADPHICVLCDITVNSKDKLNEHICVLCDITVNSEDKLNEHM